MIKVSICIPAYNNELSVRRLLESIEKQDFKDYEVVITDDSDTDEIRKLAEEKDYIKYYKNEKCLGAAANWNRAIIKSSGEYVKIMHHDDWFTDEFSLSAFVRMMEEHPEADMAFSGSRQVKKENSYDRSISEEDASLIEKDYRNLFLGNTIGAPSAVIVRKGALRASGKADGQTGILEIEYDEKLTWLVDMEYYMQILKHNPRFVYTKEPLVSIGVGQEQLTERCRDDRELNAYEYGYIYNKHQLEADKRYIKKMIEIFADAGKNVSDVRAYGIEKKEYKWELRKKVLSRIEWKLSELIRSKWLLGMLIVFFLLSLIPILMLSSVNCATGDDFGYGKLTHEAWNATHSFGKVIEAACETVHQYYHGWQGTWLSIFLFTFQPEVFFPRAYIIVPFLMIAIWLGATGLLLHYLLIGKAGFDKTFFGVVYLLFATAAIQFIPSTKSGIFWYNGAAHYVIPYAIALLAVYWYLKFMEGTGIRKTFSYAGLFIAMILLGGGNYQAALLAPIVIFLLALYYLKNKAKRKRMAACMLPFLAEAVGLVISMKSPGNAIRGGENFGFSIGLAVKTVFSCFIKGAWQAWEYMIRHPLLAVIFAAVAVIGWETLINEKEKKTYRHPIVFVILSYCVYCAMFAPGIYAGVEVSGGVYNMNYYMFLFMVFGDIIYIEGALAGGKTKKERSFILPVILFLGMLLLIGGRGDIKRTTSYQCLEYMRSGQAEDFKKQMKIQKEMLLDSDITDVVLPQINDNQGPLMHMPLTENPNSWTNSVTKEFYGKSSIIALPHEAWDELQGKKESVNRTAAGTGK